MDGQGNSFEDAPWAFRPEEMARAETLEMKPAIRKQAFPEKEDGRFFDRWVMDWAEALGSRAVKLRGLEKLGDGVLKFARWRSLRHEPKAERESREDRQTIASTQARIEKAESEVTQLEPRVRSEEQELERWQAKADDASSQRADLRPALRGAKWWDLILCAIAQIVILTVDLFVFHRSLGQIPGSDGEHWGTAASMGAGAVVVGDILGWLAAAGTVRSKGGFDRPRRPIVIATAGILIIAVWFFADLGSFREDALSMLSAEDPEIGKPSFFTLAQILFLLGAASSFFAYMARGEGRSLLKLQGLAEDRANKARQAVVQLQDQIAASVRTAGEAPVLREAALARLESRAKEAEANAALDIEQGAYLYDLIEPEYMRARANVEIGAYHWLGSGHIRRSSPELWWLSMRARFAVAVLVTLALAAAAFFIAGHSVSAAIFTAVIVAAALALTGLGSEAPSGGEDQDDGRADIFTAKFPPPTPPSFEERATDIVGLERFSANGHDGPFAEERMDGFDESA